MKNYHILNGDALKYQFPKKMVGAQIICRECLVDGPVNGHTLSDFYKTRSNFLRANYDAQQNEYEEKVIPEFTKILTIEKDASVHLWFEDDVFCQVNLWFTCCLLDSIYKYDQVFLVRPHQHTQYGFGGLSKNELMTCFENKISIDIPVFADLWLAYKDKKYDKLTTLGAQIKKKHPFVNNAIQAYIESVPTKDNLGAPINILVEIKQELKTNVFGSIFKEFCKRAPIYGYGDLQVKKLLKSIPTSN